MPGEFIFYGAIITLEQMPNSMAYSHLSRQIAFSKKHITNFSSKWIKIQIIDSGAHPNPPVKIVKLKIF